MKRLALSLALCALAAGFLGACDGIDDDEYVELLAGELAAEAVGEEPGRLDDAELAAYEVELFADEGRAARILAELRRRHPDLLEGEAAETVEAAAPTPPTSADLNGATPGEPW
jgi:hypothetical protein